MPLVSVLICGLALGAPASTPTVTGMDGRAHDLLAESKGRPLAVVFISHDCPVCNTYAPELARIAKAYRARVDVDLVYVESGLRRQDAEAHAKAYGLRQVKRFLDPGAGFAWAAKATITPEAVLFDRLGRSVYVGRIDNLYYGLGKQRPKATVHDLRAAIDAVLAGRPVKTAAGAPVGCFIEHPTKP